MVYHVLVIGSWLGFVHFSNICPKGVSFRINGIFLISISLTKDTNSNTESPNKFQHQRTQKQTKTNEPVFKLSRECMFLGSLSHHNKDLEWGTLKPARHVTALGSWTDRVTALRSWTGLVIALRQISVTAQFYLEDSRKTYLWGMRARPSKDANSRAPRPQAVELGGRERARALWLLFLCFPSPWACTMQIGLSQECCSTWSAHSGPRTFLWPFSVLFSRAFPLATAILDSFSLF